MLLPNAGPLRLELRTLNCAVQIFQHFFKIWKSVSEVSLAKFSILAIYYMMNPLNKINNRYQNLVSYLVIRLCSDRQNNSSHYRIRTVNKGSMYKKSINSSENYLNFFCNFYRFLNQRLVVNQHLGVFFGMS